MRIVRSLFLTTSWSLQDEDLDDFAIIIKFIEQRPVINYKRRLQQEIIVHPASSNKFCRCSSVPLLLTDSSSVLRSLISIVSLTFSFSSLAALLRACSANSSNSVSAIRCRAVAATAFTILHYLGAKS